MFKMVFMQKIVKCLSRKIFDKKNKQWMLENGSKGHNINKIAMRHQICYPTNK